MLVWKERGIPLYEDEVKCVKDFFHKNVEENKKDETDIIQV